MKKLLIIFFLLSVSLQGIAQRFAPFDSLVQVLEKKHAVRFFYDKRQTDGLSIPDVKGSLDEVMKATLEGTGLYHYSYKVGQVYISRIPVLFSPLAVDFFETSKVRLTDTVFKDIIPDVVVESGDRKVYIIGSRVGAGSTAVLSGYIRNSRNGEPLDQVSVTVDGLGTGVSTDPFGFFSITVPKGRQTLKLSSVGMKEMNRQLNMQGNGRMDIDMQEEVQSLRTISVVGQKQSNIRGMQMGVERLNIRAIKQIPAVLGETDILRSLQMLPGVTTVGEGTAGYNVRGGGADQNLVLLNDMTIYNPTHLFGFFSAVDPEVVRGLELYKSGVPEKLGGRISSILDISTRDGNAKKLTGSAGIGPLTSKFTLEGPLGSPKTTFLAGGRVTYSNWFMRYLPEENFGKSKVGFGDILLHLSHEVSAKDNIYVSGYLSQDMFRLNQDSTYAYANANFRIRWKHNFSDKFYQVFSAGMDKYAYSVKGRNNPEDAFDLRFGMTQWSAKSDFKYTPTNKNEVNFGVQAIQYDLVPGTLKPADGKSLVVPKNLENEKGNELSAYFGDQYRVNNKLTVQGGLRYTLFLNNGPQTNFVYAAGQPRNEGSIIDTINYRKGERMQVYHAPEIRLSARYLLNPRTSLKFSYNTLRQYLHMITNAQAISPTDIWKLSDAYIRPQIGQQFSFGFYQQVNDKGDEFTAEVYYKTTRNYLDYKSGAKLLLNDHLEQDVLSTRGKAYGIELLYKKPNGKLNGWLGYTFLRTFLQANDPLAGEVINGGNYYPANFDKPHIANLVANYRFTQRFSISLTSLYSTGRPMTFPIGVFNMAGAERVLYSDRNAYRIPDFFRTDFSMIIEHNHRVTQRYHASWTLGVYNLTGRDNPYSVYFVLNQGAMKGYQLSVFATPIPFVTFNLKF